MFFCPTVQSTGQRDLPVLPHEARRPRMVPAHQRGTAPHHQSKWPTRLPRKDQSCRLAQPQGISSFRGKVKARLHSISNYCEYQEILSSIIVLYIIALLFVIMLSVYTLTMVRVPW